MGDHTHVCAYRPGPPALPAFPAPQGGTQGPSGALLQARLEIAWRMADMLADALRLTQEYVGDETLPPLPGWSWFDALEQYAGFRR